MHPAISATIATSAAGLACGLVVLLGLIAPGKELPQSTAFGVAAFTLVLGGIWLALVHSAAGRGTIPNAPMEHRMWLIRTRYLLYINLVPTALVAFGWIVLGTSDGVWGTIGFVSTILAMLTLWTHARVYVSVVTVPAWHNRRVVLNFVAIGLLAGTLWLNALTHLFGAGSPKIALLTVVALFVAFYVKRGHWREVDRERARERAIATGPGEDEGGAHPPFYVPPERTRRLRRLAFIFMLALPLALALLGMGKSSGLATFCAVAVALSASVGLVIERWLFFTDAPTRDAGGPSVDLLT